MQSCLEYLGVGKMSNVKHETIEVLYRGTLHEICQGKDWDGVMQVPIQLMFFFGMKARMLEDTNALYIH